MNAAEIAAKLTKAQREAVTYDGFWWEHSKGISGAGPALLALTRKELTLGRPTYRLTPLGLAVRAILQAKEPTDER